MMTTQVGFISFYSSFALSFGVSKMAGKLFERHGEGVEGRRVAVLGLIGTGTGGQPTL